MRKFYNNQFLTPIFKRFLIISEFLGGTSMDEMMKGVPPNVTMLPSLDNTG